MADPIIMLFAVQFDQTNNHKSFPFLLKAKYQVVPFDVESRYHCV